MFQKSKATPKTVATMVIRSIFLTGWITAPAAGNIADFDKSSSRCADAIAVDINQTLRGYGVEASQWIDFKVEIPEPGILTLDANAPVSATEPSIGLFEARCNDPKAGEKVTVVQRFPDHMSLAIHNSGDYVFRLAAQEPLQPLQEYEIRTDFKPQGSSEVAGWEKGDEVIEIDPDQVSIPPVEPALMFDLPCLKFRSSPEEIDDHSDTFLCATPLSPGEATAGEIGGWEADSDVFELVLGGSAGDDLWQVRLETTGEVDTLGGLYDRHGLLLAKAGDGGPGTNFHIAKTLSPGQYFVRIEGRHYEQGPYSLAVEAAPW